MGENYETVREVGIALEGFRSEVVSQLGTLKWVIGGVGGVAAALGVGAVVHLSTKIDALEESAARHTAILERIEVSIRDVASDTGSIRENIEAAQAPRNEVDPSADAFAAWNGIQITPAEFDTEAFINIIQDFSGDGQSPIWIYAPEGG